MMVRFRTHALWVRYFRLIHGLSIASGGAAACSCVVGRYGSGFLHDPTRGAGVRSHRRGCQDEDESSPSPSDAFPRIEGEEREPACSCVFSITHSSHSLCLDVMSREVHLAWDCFGRRELRTAVSPWGASPNGNIEDKGRRM